MTGGEANSERRQPSMHFNAEACVGINGEREKKCA
jgi:hypothetical protein